MDLLELCMGCMANRGQEEVCPRCRYREGTPAETPIHLPPRTELHGQYLIGRVLGHGGFGITYIGWDKHLQRRLAVKEYFPSGVAMRSRSGNEVSAYSTHLQKDFDYGLERYLEEARMVARFAHHPNILSVLSFFRDNGTAYIVMEYLEGRTLEAHLDRVGGRISVEEAIGIAVPVMDALAEVHAEGILHRDVSPDNIHLGPNRQVKLLDFGAARMALGERSRNLSVILKEGYTPGEQYRAKGPQGPWTDVYALAATLYRAMTGVLPPGALDRVTEDELKPPRSLGVEMSERQEAALLKAMALDPSARFETIRQFREALIPAGGAITASSPLLDAPPAISLPEPAAPVTTRFPEFPPPDPAPPAKKGIPAWAWSAASGAVVLLVLFALRPGPPRPAPPPVPAVSAQPAAPPGEKTPPPAQPALPEPAPPAQPRYEDLVAKAGSAQQAAEAVELARAAIEAGPDRWEAYDLLAQVQLYNNGDFGEAAVNYRKSLDRGGFATFHVELDREDGRRSGRLRLARDSIAYVDSMGTYNFTARMEDVKEFRATHAAGPWFPGAASEFHALLGNGEDYTFCGLSKDKSKERDLILQLAGER
ncbi:MAG: Serine/threonine-protein kinase PknD [Bryobacteraceae bacterium]|nr:Serine/threonine-protein kinase PknD [Bryobacteraceae bacterium]